MPRDSPGILLVAAQIVQRQIGLGSRLQQARRVGLSPRLEQLHRLVDRDRHLGDRVVGNDDFAHVPRDDFEIPCRERLAIVDPAVERARRRRRMFDRDTGPREEFIHGGDQQHDQRAAVDARPDGIGEQHRCQVGVVREHRGELDEPSVDRRRDGRDPTLVRDGQHIAQRRAGRRLEDALVGKADLQVIARRSQTDHAAQSIAASRPRQLSRSCSPV